MGDCGICGCCDDCVSCLDAPPAATFTVGIEYIDPTNHSRGICYSSRPLYTTTVYACANGPNSTCVTNLISDSEGCFDAGNEVFTTSIYATVNNNTEETQTISWDAPATPDSVEGIGVVNLNSPNFCSHIPPAVVAVTPVWACALNGSQIHETGLTYSSVISANSSINICMCLGLGSLDCPICACPLSFIYTNRLFFNINPEQVCSGKGIEAPKDVVVPMSSNVKELISTTTDSKGCTGCAQREQLKKLGLLSYLKAKTSGLVEEDIQSKRLEICKNCKETEKDTNNQLYRVIENKSYCGQPRLENIYRDEVEVGCGCNIEDKVKWNMSACPRMKWGPSDRFQ